MEPAKEARLPSRSSQTPRPECSLPRAPPSSRASAFFRRLRLFRRGSPRRAPGALLRPPRRVSPPPRFFFASSAFRLRLLRLLLQIRRSAFRSASSAFFFSASASTPPLRARRRRDVDVDGVQARHRRRAACASWPSCRRRRACRPACWRRSALRAEDHAGDASAPPPAPLARLDHAREPATERGAARRRVRLRDVAVPLRTATRQPRRVMAASARSSISSAACFSSSAFSRAPWRAPRRRLFAAARRSGARARTSLRAAPACW